MENVRFYEMVRGASAYEVEVKNGFEGTEEEWIASLHGASVTVKSISESTEDGGENVVTFSDGKKLSVKNGNTGAPGHTPVKGEDYWTASDKDEIVNDVLNQLPEEGGGSAPADRTHGVDQVEVLPETSLSRNAGEDHFSLPDTLDLIIGREYTVKWNGVEYTCAAVEAGNNPVVIGLGNLAAMGVPVDASNEPFAIAEIAGDSNLTIYPLDDSTSLTISIRENIVRKLDNKYLDLDWIPSKTEQVILAEQTVVDNRLEAIDTQYLVENTPVIVYINGIPFKSEIIYTAVDGWYINLDVKISTSINGKVLFMLSETVTQILIANLTGQTVKICLAEYEKIPEEYLPDNIVGNTNAVQYTAQTLTEAQKAQARQNIGAAAVGEGGGSGGVSVPADWNAAEGEAGHILNRPFYSEYKPVTLLGTTTLTASGSFAGIDGVGFLTALLDVSDGMECIITYNGVEYTCTARATTFNDIPCCILGNSYAFGDENTGEPFLVCAFSEEVASQVGIYGGVIPLDGSGSFSISVTHNAETVIPVPQKYLPKMFHVVTLPAMEDRPSAGSNPTVNITDPDGEIIKALWNHIPVYIDFSLVRGTEQNGNPFNQSLVTAFATSWPNDYVKTAIETGNASIVPFYMRAFEELNGCEWRIVVNGYD